MYLQKFILFIFFGISGFSLSVFAQSGEPITDLKAFCSKQKGFNLMGKFDISWNNIGFVQKEFSVIHDLGFNFVRLPLDYRTYTQAGNWEIFTETQVAQLDQAIEWGELYNIHVCINLVRAPGYCVNKVDNLPVNQQLDLWTDMVAQNAFVKHWEFFANRYKNISPERLSFNLVNEPTNVSEEVYISVMKKAIKVIHNISPNRIIFIDGLDYASKILLSLKDDPNIAQSIHCYIPFTLTHYKAEWVTGSTDWQVPQWPMYRVCNYLCGPWKSELKSPLVFQGNFTQGTEVIVNVGQVSIESTLQVKAGTKIILNKRFACGPDLGTDFTKISSSEWGYLNTSNKDYSAILTGSATSLTFENISGDWMTINSISVKQGTNTRTYYLSDNSWGKKQESYKIDEFGILKTLEGKDLLPFNEYQSNIDLAKSNNIPFMVQEFGVYNQTPHKVTVDFLADLTSFFRANYLGFALWNLTGSFGILNSNRTDCTYETYQGYKLDREMLDALTKSGVTSAATVKKPNFFQLFPVPAKNELFFSSDTFNGTVKIEIRDITGRILKTFNTEIAGNEKTRLDISGMKPGMYLLSAANNGKTITGKFLVE